MFGLSWCNKFRKLIAPYSVKWSVLTKENFTWKSSLEQLEAFSGSNNLEFHAVFWNCECGKQPWVTAVKQPTLKHWLQTFCHTEEVMWDMIQLQLQPNVFSVWMLTSYLCAQACTKPADSSLFIMNIQLCGRCMLYKHAWACLNPDPSCLFVTSQTYVYTYIHILLTEYCDCTSWHLCVWICCLNLLSFVVFWFYVACSSLDIFCCHAGTAVFHRSFRWSCQSCWTSSWKQLRWMLVSSFRDGRYLTSMYEGTGSVQQTRSLLFQLKENYAICVCHEIGSQETAWWARPLLALLLTI